MIKLNQELIWHLTLIVGLCTAGVAGAGGVPDFGDAKFDAGSQEEIALGQLLFYDPILSGNRNTACATCHHPRFGTSDGVSLALGEGGVGLGPDRRPNPANLPEQRIGRNAPALFNLGASQFTTLFHDGRVAQDASRSTGIRTPLGDGAEQGANSVLAAQAMFPVLSADEMSGHYSENDVSRAVRQGLLSQKGGAWDIIAARVAAIPQYRAMFDGVIGAREIQYSDIANMIASFEAFEWRADDSAFDRYLAGTDMADDEMAGMALFYGKAGCSACHAGRFQTDHGFHAIAMPQIGPGKAAPFESHHRDTGRIGVTGQAGDAYRFRTPSLRNITATAPYGHDGAYATLDAVVRHHLDPVVGLMTYDPAQAILPQLGGVQDWHVLNDPAELAAIAAANELAPVSLSDGEFDQLIAFLGALTDYKSLTGRLGIPQSVPSGLAVN